MAEKKNKEEKKRKARASALHGIIAMVIITAVIAGAVYVYVNSILSNGTDEAKEQALDYAKQLDWSEYQGNCTYLFIDFEDMELNDVVFLREEWWKIPAVWRKLCTGPWDDKDTYAYFNLNGLTHVEPVTDTNDYLRELVNINLQIKEMLSKLT